MISSQNMSKYKNNIIKPRFISCSVRDDERRQVGPVMGVVDGG